MRSLGWLPDRPDARDRLFAASVGASLPESAQLDHYSPTVLDQGRIGSCVANAGFEAIRISQGYHSMLVVLGARLWGYALARAYDGTPLADDVGTHIRSFFYAISKHGFPREEDYSCNYDVGRFSESPHPSDYRKAFDQRKVGAVSYERISTVGAARLEDIRSSIAEGAPVVFGTSVSTAFTSQGRNDELWFPPLGEPIAGGHAMVVTGYDGEVFKVKNSWGTDVGVGGFHRFAGSYMAWSGTRDLWAVRFSPSFS